MRKLKALWWTLKLVKIAWQNERRAIKTLTPQQLHERQYIRCVQQMWVWDRKGNDRQVERFWKIAYNEGCWLVEHGYPLPVVPVQPHMDPVAHAALNEYNRIFHP